MTREELLANIRSYTTIEPNCDLNDCLDYVLSLSTVELAELFAATLVLSRDEEIKGKETVPRFADWLTTDGTHDDRLFSWEKLYELGTWLLGNSHPYVRSEGAWMILAAGRVASDEEHARRLADFLGDREAVAEAESSGGFAHAILWRTGRDLSFPAALRVMPHIMYSQEIRRRANRDVDLILAERSAHK